MEESPALTGMVHQPRPSNQGRQPNGGLIGSRLTFLHLQGAVGDSELGQPLSRQVFVVGAKLGFAVTAPTRAWGWRFTY